MRRRPFLLTNIKEVFTVASKRRKEVEKLISFIGNGKVNVVTGLRRSGKHIF